MVMQPEGSPDSKQVEIRDEVADDVKTIPHSTDGQDWNPYSGHDKSSNLASTISSNDYCDLEAASL
jgi:hypothetical protein